MMSRRSTVLLCLLVAVALVVGGVFVARWQRSPGHRADQLADSVRSMPGVSSVSLRDPDPDTRMLFIRMPASASRSQLHAVHERAADLPSELFVGAKVTIGAATSYVELPASSDRTDEQFALRKLRHSTVDLDSGPTLVWGVSDESAAVATQEIEARLAESGATRPSRAEVTVRSEDLSSANVHDQVSVPAAHAVLDELAPQLKRLYQLTVSEQHIEITVAHNQRSHDAEITAAAKRAAGMLRDSHGRPATYTVNGVAG